MAAQRGDGFEAHPAVDGLGGEGVAQPVGVHGVDAGDGADAGHDPVDGAPVDRGVVIGEQPTGGAGCALRWWRSNRRNRSTTSGWSGIMRSLRSLPTGTRSQ
jgi:hypothetical protein